MLRRAPAAVANTTAPTITTRNVTMQRLRQRARICGLATLQIAPNVATPVRPRHHDRRDLGRELARAPGGQPSDRRGCSPPFDGRGVLPCAGSSSPTGGGGTRHPWVIAR